MMTPTSERADAVEIVPPGMAPRRPSTAAPISRRRALAVLGLGPVSVFLVGCGSAGGLGSNGGGAGEAADFAARFAGFEPADEPNGDLSNVVWPGWMDRFDPEVRRLYAFQVENGDLMRWMPCFCGCGQSDGHRSNRDCYVEAVNPDGSVVFDSMAPT